MIYSIYHEIKLHQSARKCGELNTPFVRLGKEEKREKYN